MLGSETSKRGETVSRLKINYLIDLILTTLFFVVASTGLFMYFLIPSGIPRGRYVVYMGLTKATWIWVHSRAGILIVILIVVHFILHSQWIICTTKSFFRKGKKNAICEGNKVTDKVR
ncbi:MAG TPA: DUF4405 domain-containing protein [Methanosarcina sp.]|nr:DUF4405 domain-containing protein [Methanosarcina sp.]